MTVKEAERAFEEMLPCEFKGYSALYKSRYERPIEIRYKKGGSMLTSVYLVFEDERVGRRCTCEIPIEKLRLVEGE